MLAFPCVLGQVPGRREIYDPLLERLLDGPMTVAEARALPRFRAAPLSDLLQAFALLVSGGHAHPVLAAPTHGAAARRFNAAVIRLNALGGDIPWLASPLAGTALPADVMETLIAGALLDGAGADVPALVEAVFGRLRGSGRSVQRDGKAVSDEAAARALVGASVAAMLGRRGDPFRRLGILDR